MKNMLFILLFSSTSFATSMGFQKGDYPLQIKNMIKNHTVVIKASEPFATCRTSSSSFFGDPDNTHTNYMGRLTLAGPQSISSGATLDYVLNADRSNDVYSNAGFFTSDECSFGVTLDLQIVNSSTGAVLEAGRLAYGGAYLVKNTSGHRDILREMQLNPLITITIEQTASRGDGTVICEVAVKRNVDGVDTVVGLIRGTKDLCAYKN